MGDEKDRYDSYACMLAGRGPESGMYIQFILFLYMITYRAGNYYLERECLATPESLQKLIFPLIEQTDAINKANDPNLQDIARRSFMELLRWFRIIILQDIVFIRDKFPDSSLWNHYIFRLPQFEEFATRLKIEVRHGDESRMVSISRIAPEF